jgi:16S rRNA (cytosine1402-N4)-methyltransferase
LPHKSVLLEETMVCLNLKEGEVVFDGTAGNGGHGAEALKRIGAAGKLIAVDQDPRAVERCRQVFKDDPRVILLHENYKNVAQVLNFIKLHTIDAVILDVGVSSEQLDDPDSGFSFLKEGPLDMRMNTLSPHKAAHLVNRLPEKELEKIFREYGEERWAGRIARCIAERRRTRRFESTTDLSETIRGAVPSRFHERHRHPATRVFQALRIAVNDELNTLREGLAYLWACLSRGGRMAVITFHSLEDRIVKQQFQSWVREGGAKAITKKPLMPSAEEIAENPRARSAKLRAVEKVA